MMLNESEQKTVSNLIDKLGIDLFIDQISKIMEIKYQVIILEKPPMTKNFLNRFVKIISILKKTYSELDRTQKS